MAEVFCSHLKGVGETIAVDFAVGLSGEAVWFGRD